MPPRRRILLVEDSPTQAERLKTLIAADDLEIVHVPSAEEALQQLQECGTDLVLLDFHLPGMNGDEFCREIRMNVNTRAVPVLMLTVEGSDAAEMRGLESGADGYLAKSADPDVLQVRIRSLLRRSEGSAAILDDDKLFGRARVLALDDSPTYLHRLAYELAAEHYSVETSLNPADALGRLREASYDCVLLDFELPGMDGAEVCRRIREMKRESEPELVIVMLTSHDDKEHMSLGFNAGIDDYIAKSSDLAVIKARIRALLRRKFLVEENRRILNELRDKELQAVRARAEREAAELRATLADRLAAANRDLESANRKLDAANKELEQFAHSAAHDLQEPLRMVGIFSQLLKAKYETKLDQTADQYIAHCVEGVKRMDNLIKDLLSYARAAASGDLSTELVDFNLVLDRALQNLHSALGESRAEVFRETLPSLRVAEIRIQQVFQNLIGNALKYRRPDEPPCIRVSAKRQEREWLFSVADNGIGIAPQYHDVVFGVFRRLDNATDSGSGLGLAICQRTIEHHGGRIWVESEGGHGSNFFFTLPVALEEAGNG